MPAFGAIHDSFNLYAGNRQRFAKRCELSREARDNVSMRQKETLVKAAFAVAFVTACSSSSGIVSQAIEGGPGQEIVVSIAGVETGALSDREGSHEYEVQIEVSNDSNLPQTVTRITIKTEGNGAFQLQPSSQSFNEMIDPGKDYVFTVRARGRLVRAFGATEQHVVDVRCIVTLANGDSYFYTFEGPVRETTTP